MNHNIFLRAIAISLVSNNGKFSYSQTGGMYSKVSSYQIKRWLDKNRNEQEELEKYITQLNIDWSKGWLMIDDTVIEKPFSKTNECVYWQYSSKNADFITGISLTVLLLSDGVKNIPIRFMVYEKDTNGKPIRTKNKFVSESLQYALRLGIRPFKVCFDSKYSSSKLLNRLNNNNLRYYVYACIHALMLLERQNKRSLYKAKKYFQQKFIGIKHNGNRVLRLLAV